LGDNVQQKTMLLNMQYCRAVYKVAEGNFSNVYIIRSDKYWTCCTNTLAQELIISMCLIWSNPNIVIVGFSVKVVNKLV